MAGNVNAAVITGGSQGLGLAIARQLIAEGCGRVAISGRNEAKGRAAAEDLSRSGAKVVFIAADIAKVEDCFALIDRAAAELGALDGLVNAAAACDRGSLIDTTPEIWSMLFDTNARGPFFTMQRFAQLAIAAGKPASIVNIVSMVIYAGQSYLAPYSASKAALANITKNAAQALRFQHIRCNAIACGWMDTPGEDATQRAYHGAGDDWLAIAEAKQPFGQLLKPEHVAPMAAHLLSPRSGVITGSIIDADQNVAGAYPE